MFKYAKYFLIKLLTLLINQTLSTGIFLYELKISRVWPLFQNCDTSNINNYRPISILHSISIIFVISIGLLADPDKIRLPHSISVTKEKIDH